MKATKLLPISTMALCCTFLLGCATQKERLLSEGYSLSYAEGFDDGCYSGDKAVDDVYKQVVKDTERFEHDSQYAQGWSDGYTQCKTKQEESQHLLDLFSDMRERTE